MINKSILKLAVPSILANLTVPLVGIVDIAVAGRIGNAATIGAIALGTMLFDLLYWNFGFLRVGTGGLTAQAYGRKDFSEAIMYFGQGIMTALVSAFAVLLIQYLVVETAFLFIDSSPEVAAFSKQYFYIRIWAAPAAITLFVFRGWFIGMQNTVSPMIVDTTINILNLVLSVYLALYTPLSFAGIAYGTVIAQYVGLFLAIGLMYKYYGKLFKYLKVKAIIRFKDMGRFFSLNGNIFIRSICFTLIYSGFTFLSSKYGDTVLAASSIMMKLMLLFSYFIDGFAYAGEALVGRYIGAKEPVLLRRAVKWLFVWAIGIGIVSTIMYVFLDEWMVGVMTTSVEVAAATDPFLIWLLFMPIISCAAFMWDGIYIGATAGKDIRNCMIYSAIAFYLAYFLLEKSVGIQALWWGYFAHLLVRTIFLSLRAKKVVFIDSRS